MNDFIKPAALKAGDKVAIVAPAGKVEKEYIEKTVSIFKSWGLEVELGEYLFSEFHQFAGTDNQRLEDFQQAIDSDDIKAVICARGGYGAVRIIDKVNWGKFLQKPKWVVGFSDITAFHCSIQNLGIQSLHGIMPINMAGLDIDSQPVEMLRKALFGEKIGYELPAHHLNVTGTVKAEVVGGNLSLLYGLIGSAFVVDFENKILFIEDVGEQYYHIDRMMQSLRLSGVFNTIKGLIVGGLTEMSDKKRPFGKNPEEIIAEVVGGLGIPVVFGFPAGHQKENLPLVFGGTVSMEVGGQFVKISYR